MSRSKSFYAACLFLMLCASSLSAAAFRVQLLGLPLPESKPEHRTSALGIVGSYIPDICTVQLAPGYSISDTVEGLQLGGVFSICRSLQGHQMSIGFNLSKENRGQQIAGVFNHCSLLEGRQIGILNLATEGNGLQVGIFNYAGEGSSLSIGLINIRDRGLLRWVTRIDHHGNIFTGLQSGGAHLYTITFHGISDQSSSFAIGGHLKAARFFSDVEAGIHIPSGVQAVDEVSALVRIRPGITLTGRLNLFGSAELRTSRSSGSSLSGSLGIAWGR